MLNGAEDTDGDSVTGETECPAFIWHRSWYGLLLQVALLLAQ